MYGGTQRDATGQLTALLQQRLQTASAVLRAAQVVQRTARPSANDERRLKALYFTNLGL